MLWFEELQKFFESGGDVLWAILVVAIILWSLILERYWFYFIDRRKSVRKLIERWQQRADKESWYALKIRQSLVSENAMQLDQNLLLIKTLVALCPLLGLLGTVTGMIHVFDVMAALGSTNARAMAGGISMATIPTMAGMVMALPGLYFSARLQQRANVEKHRFEDQL